MASVLRDLKEAKFSSELLDAYQTIQYHHDERYHPDIVALGVARRMTHIALHLTKYLSPLMSEKSEDQYNVAFVDSFIMIVSACNLLNMRITKLGDANIQSINNYHDSYVANLSSLAKACESADHQEDFPIHDVWKRTIKNLYQITISAARITEMNLLAMATERLGSIEKNHELAFIINKNL